MCVVTNQVWSCLCKTLMGFEPCEPVASAGPDSDNHIDLAEGKTGRILNPCTGPSWVEVDSKDKKCALCQKGDTSPGSYQDRKAAEKEMVKKEIEEAKQIAVKKAAEEKKNIEGALEMMQEAEKQAGGDHGGGLFAPLS
ncbi:MAG: hypothetical protein Q9175_002674 [Cornicularia normoerica]